MALYIKVETVQLKHKAALRNSVRCTLGSSQWEQSCRLAMLPPALKQSGEDLVLSARPGKRPDSLTVSLLPVRACNLWKVLHLAVHIGRLKSNSWRVRVSLTHMPGPLTSQRYAVQEVDSLKRLVSSTSALLDAVGEKCVCEQPQVPWGVLTLPAQQSPEANKSSS